MVNIQKPTKIMSKVIDDSDIPTDTQALTFDSASNTWLAEDAGGAGRQFLAKVDLSGGAATSITASSLTAFNEYEVMFGTVNLSAADIGIRFNSDAGANYKRKTSIIFSTTTLQGSQSQADTAVDYDTAVPANDRQRTKIRISKWDDDWWAIIDGMRDNLSVPTGVRIFSGGFWNDSSQITSITILASAGNLSTATEMTVWGIADS